MATATPEQSEVLVTREDIRLLCAAAQRDHGIVLEEEDNVANAAADARLDERSLEGVRTFVGDAPEPIRRDAATHPDKLARC